MFTYSPLRRDVLEIRLVRLIRPASVSANDSTGTLCLEVQHALIDQVSFNALSYVWGSVENPMEISLNGASLSVGQNLYSGLKQLFENKVTSWLWIDALCIQQSDSEEKSHQVTNMRTIFGQADCVFSWLGPGDVSTDKAMDFMALMGPRALSFGDDPHIFGTRMVDLREAFKHVKNSPETPFVPKSTTWKPDVLLFLVDILLWPDLHTRAKDDRDSLIAGILSMMEREYWGRIWVNQEVSLAKEVMVMCGTKCVSLDHIEATCAALHECRAKFNYITSDQNFAQGVDHSAFQRLPLHCRRLFRGGHGIPLYYLLHRTAVPRRDRRPLYAASDPRDILFGLLGIITDKDSLGLSADYLLTTAEVFTKITRALISAGDIDKKKRSYQLDHCVPREGCSRYQLPSWVPDWQERGELGVSLSRIANLNRYNASKDILVPMIPVSKTDDSLGILRRAGCRVDLITSVMPHKGLVPPRRSWKAQTSQEWLSAIISFVGLDTIPSPGEDYVWRTLLHQGLFLRGIYPFNEEDGKFIRKIMRLEAIDTEVLKAKERRLLDGLSIIPLHAEKLLPQPEQYEMAIRKLRNMALCATNRRTLFKTQKGMFGLGYPGIKPGDIVILLWGSAAPYILRPRDKPHCDGFVFVGDAYVDQIMHGEFLETNPAHEIFTIY